MAGELGYNPATGQLVYSPATGQLALDCDWARYKLIPCIVEGSDCNRCIDGITPLEVSVTFHDIVWCTGCIENRDYDTKWTSPPPVFSGPYVLQQTSSCTWGAWINGTAAYVNYPEDNCTGTPGATQYITKFYLEVKRWVADYVPRISVNMDGYQTGLWGPEYDRSVFVGWLDVSSLDDCPEDRTVPDGSDCTYQSDWTYTPGHEAGAYAVVVAGDTEDPNPRCPGGDPYYTNTDLAADVGNIIEISEDEGICYKVTVNTDNESADGTATKIHCWTTCEKCCNDEDEDC